MNNIFLPKPGFSGVFTDCTKGDGNNSNSSEVSSCSASSSLSSKIVDVTLTEK
jgi:hypothetical protein